MLTKEEYLQALKDLFNFAVLCGESETVLYLGNHQYELYKLINEHFELVKESESLTSQLVECQRVCKVKQEKIEELQWIANNFNAVASLYDALLKDYEKLQRDFDIAYKLYDELRENFINLWIDNKTEWQGLYRDNEELKKALDRACENLECEVGMKTKEEWKKELLEDA